MMFRLSYYLVAEESVAERSVGKDGRDPQPSPHFFASEINGLPLNGQQAVTAITALWLWRSTAFRSLQQPIGRHLVIDVAKQVIQRHPEVQNEGMPEAQTPLRRGFFIPATHQNFQKYFY